jgi:hypothetical protein
MTKLKSAGVRLAIRHEGDVVIKSAGVRLAIRHEGDVVNAYLAKEGTMEGAILLGSIMYGIVKGHPDIWDRWKEIMTDAMARGIKEVFNQEPKMVERSAPPSERAGRA